MEWMPNLSTPRRDYLRDNVRPLLTARGQEGFAYKPGGFFEDSDSESCSPISEGSTRKGNVTAMMNFWQLSEGKWNYWKN
ncbi:hypothetical protein DPMN_089457 [Dreissena polymorpha]|uniref:Uncharacterized protein n=1 Tax=Dreissena polymorpha TaxID=45954 RepID=A0A9D4QY82_DREPO|nr:hypothetical protein DPMN_089457 [Dreissena polymorpha]